MRQLSEKLKIASDKKVLRQDRFEPDLDTLVVCIGHNKYPILNYSSFGIAFIADTQEVQANQTIMCEIFLEEILITRISIRAVHFVQLQNGKLKIGAEVVGEPIDCDRIKATYTAVDCLKGQISDIARFADVPLEFKAKVALAVDFLSDLESRINDLESFIPTSSNSERLKYEEYICELIGSFLDRHFSSFYSDLNKTLVKIDKDSKAICISYFKSRLISYISKSPFADRAISKPLGYAGDYEMMNLIYRNEAIGKTLFAKALNKYFVGAPASKAVRNRADYLEQLLTEAISRTPDSRLRILSVACGPAVEVQRILRKRSQNVSFTLLDQDTQALKHAQRKIKEIELESINKFDVNYLNQSIKNVIIGGLDGEYDLIYSAGLFDYFSNDVAQIAASKLYDSLSADGELIIGNFSDINTDQMQLTMDVALDWHLIYRSEKQLKELFDHIGNTFKIEKEPEGVNLFCRIKK